VAALYAWVNGWIWFNKWVRGSLIVIRATPRFSLPGNCVRTPFDHRASSVLVRRRLTAATRLGSRFPCPAVNCPFFQSVRHDTLSPTMKIQLEPSKIRERDLNLLLLEEMYSSADFQQKIREKLGFPPDASFDCGRHQVVEAFGESDLELDFVSQSGVYRVLVEDKIDARFQPDQILRYQKRAEYYVCEKRPNCKDCKTVLFAPRFYAPSKVKGYKALPHLQYEELRDWYKQCADGDSRIEWKIALLDAAIKKHQESQKSGVGKPDESARKFREGYWTMANQEFSDLAMPQPLDRVGGFIYLYPASLLKRVYLVLSPSKGKVALWFGGVSGKSGEKEIRTLFGAALDRDMDVRGAARNVMLTLKGQPMNRRGDFFRYAVEARAGLKLARRLAKWLEVNGHLWSEYLS
jgi:hypothetical protein